MLGVLIRDKEEHTERQRERPDRQRLNPLSHKMLRIAKGYQKLGDKHGLSSPSEPPTLRIP